MRSLRARSRSQNHWSAGRIQALGQALILPGYCFMGMKGKNISAQQWFSHRLDPWPRLAIATLCFTILLSGAPLPALAQGQESKAPAQQPDVPNAQPRGKKLFLTDGSVHIIRSYERQGDRVRFYSIERSAWEEIPASLVDWDATRRDEAEAASLDAKIEAKKKEFRMARIAAEVDADASLEVAPGLFLPDPPGVFVLEGRNFRSLPLVGAGVKRDKGRIATQILVPIPLPVRHNVQLPGEHSAFRIRGAQPEFFIRTTDGHEPEIELIQARVKGGVREIERISTIFTGNKNEKRNSISIERWKLAKGVYRLTLSQALAPGEYVFAEFLPDEGMDLGVWEFGVDASPSAAPPSTQKPPQR